MAEKQGSRLWLYFTLLLGAVVGFPLAGMIYFFEWGPDHTWVMENLIVVPIGYVVISIGLLWANFASARPSKDGGRNFLSAGGILTTLLYVVITLIWGTPLVTGASWDAAHEVGLFDGNDPFKLGWNLDQYADRVPREYRSNP